MNISIIHVHNYSFRLFIIVSIKMDIQVFLMFFAMSYSQKPVFFAALQVQPRIIRQFIELYFDTIVLCTRAMRTLYSSDKLFFIDKAAVVVHVS